MSLTLVRVDDRLIHGQVVAVWLRAIGADRIVIVDDRTAGDAFLRDVLLLSAPPGIPVEVHGLSAGGPRLRVLAEGSGKAMVLLRSPRTALELRRQGVPIETLNLGGLGASPGRHGLYRTISASADELTALRELEALGTRVEIRIVPDDRPVAFASVDPAA